MLGNRPWLLALLVMTGQASMALAQDFPDWVPLQGLTATPAPSGAVAASATELEPGPSVDHAAGGKSDCHKKDCKGGWIAGAGAYYLRPFFEDNTAASILVTDGITTSVTENPLFDWNYSVSPLVWLGYVNANGWGFRTRYFHFDQSSDPVTVVNPGSAPVSIVNAAPGLPLPFNLLGLPTFQSSTPGDILTFQSDLRFYTLDFEVIKQASTSAWDLEISGGGRYLQAAQNYSGLLVSATRSTVDFGHNFNGGGPTLAGRLQWRAGESRFALFGQARGSLLVGSSQQNFAATAADGAIQETSFVTQDDVLPIAELELGGRYGGEVGDAGWFVEVAVVDQTYFGLGSASTPEGNLSLFGFQASAGIDY